MARIGIEALRGGTVGTSGGVDVYARGLVQALGAFGVQHTYTAFSRVVHAQGKPSASDLVSWAGVAEGTGSVRYFLARLLWRLRRCSAREFWPAWGAWQFARAARSRGVQLVHFPRTYVPFAPPRIPYVLTFFDMQHEYHPEFFTANELRRRAETYRPSVDAAQHIIASSEFTARCLRETYGTVEERISVVRPGIDDGYGAVDASEEARVREAYGLPDRFLFYPANPWPHKNHPRLLCALRALRERHPDLHLVVAGRLNNERWHVGYLAEAAGVTDAVHDLGFLPTADVRGLYAAAEMLVFPSLFEGFGIPVLEAMACGCPVVTSSATCLPEVAGEAGLQLDPLSVQAWVEAIERVWQDEGLRRDMSAKGRLRARNYLWSDVVPVLESVYSRVIETLG